jgi:hypothetical protein
MSIKNITATDSELNTNRTKQISHILKPLIPKGKVMYPTRVPSMSGDRSIVFCVTDSSKITDSGQFDQHSEITERFKTVNPDFNASYYEIWHKVLGSKNIYNLNRIYFHLYRSENDDEYILLHTDPNDADMTHGNYKRSPHLHIKYASDNIIPHAHLALNINDYDMALSNLDEMNKCFKNHIDMLSHQILNIR